MRKFPSKLALPVQMMVVLVSFSCDERSSSVGNSGRGGKVEEMFSGDAREARSFSGKFNSNSTSLDFLNKEPSDLSVKELVSIVRKIDVHRLDGQDIARILDLIDEYPSRKFDGFRRRHLYYFLDKEGVISVFDWVMNRYGEGELRDFYIHIVMSHAAAKDVDLWSRLYREIETDMEKVTALTALGSVISIDQFSKIDDEFKDEKFESYVVVHYITNLIRKEGFEGYLFNLKLYDFSSSSKRAGVLRVMSGFDFEKLEPCVHDLISSESIDLSNRDVIDSLAGSASRTGVSGFNKLLEFSDSYNFSDEQMDVLIESSMRRALSRNIDLGISYLDEIESSEIKRKAVEQIVKFAMKHGEFDVAEKWKEYAQGLIDGGGDG
ncbi:hypothetical protein [Roseibacillus ishigakijimensis]|uniref:Uncharacterized protein n=1 Tax=Roseibacillus ishigakijimensis TaxID=454146 RepID=A0A934VNT1_9BACT|nr:hypothetical protein [Roseibacillus ishigakijimensis]MBK1835355.1 hypothetical protein [Roseibacillus ishigakijimensis]